MSAAAIIGSAVAASIMGSTVAASIIDSTVATSAVISLHYLTGRHWDWVCCLIRVMGVLLVARQATGKAQSIVKAALILCV